MQKLETSLAGRCALSTGCRLSMVALKETTMRILLVEDDRDFAQFIRKGLKEEHYAVDFAVDGEAGLAMALNNPYDLLILDIMLPKMDGLAVCLQFVPRAS